jgi:hypothetical protein
MSTRSPTPRASRLLSLITFSTLLGCSEPAETDDSDDVEDLGPPGDPIVMDELEGCEGIPYMVSFDYVVPSGRSGALVVAEYAGLYTSDLQWSPPDEVVGYELPLEPSGVELSFDFSDTPEQLRWIDAGDCGVTRSCGHGCGTRLEIPAVLRVLSDDGTLDEELTVIVEAMEDRVQVRRKVNPGELNGSIDEGTFTTDPDWDVLQYQLEAEIHDDGQFRGRYVLALADPDGLLWFRGLGVWPAPP